MNNMNPKAKQFNHELIINAVIEKIGKDITIIKDWNFTYFERHWEHLGFIEKISAGKYPYTIYISFNDRNESVDYNKSILLYIASLYKAQKRIINNNKEWYNVELAFQDFFGSELI